MITDEQLDNFVEKESPGLAVQLKPVPASGPTWIKPIGIQDRFDKSIWNTEKIGQAEKDLQSAVGANDLIPPNEVEQNKRLNWWWRETGQFMPRHVLDRLGIVGGAKVPTLEESIRLESKQQAIAVKDYLGIKRPENKDPLEALVPIDMDISDPKDISKPKPIEPKIANIIKAASDEDLKVIRTAIASNPLEFDEGLYKAIEDETRIREILPDVYKMVGEKPLTILLGTDFFNTLAFNLPEYTSRKGGSPAEALLGLPKGSESVYIRAVARLREQIAEEDPRILTKIGLESGNISATLIKFALMPDPTKLRIIASLSPVVKAAIGVGTKAGLVELLQAPEPEETLEQRIESTVVSTGIGALTGAVLQKAITFIKDIPVNMQAAKLAEKFPQIKQKEWVEILKVAKENRLISLEVKPRISPAHRVAPKGFRVAMADIEPIKKVGKAVSKAVPKTKEALAVEAAKALIPKALKVKPVLPAKIVSPEEAGPFGITFKGGEETAPTKVIVDPKVRRSIQASEKKIAGLKTQLKQQQADKKVALAKITAVEIAKKQEALAKLKERTGIKLEKTIEGAKAKIAKIRAATEFKDSLRNDAVSMITSLPKELRAGFINRANKVKTLKGIQKLTDEIEASVDKFDRKLAVGELRETIKKLESENRLGKVRLGKVPSPQREKMMEIIDEISTRKISTKLTPELAEKPPSKPPGAITKPGAVEAPVTEEPRVKTFGELDVKARRGREQLLGADLKSLQKVTQRLSSELAGSLEALDEGVDQVSRLPNARVKQLNLLTQKNVDEIDTEDIKLVSESLQQLANNAKLKGQLLTKTGYKPLKHAVKTISETEIATTSAATRKAGKEAKGVAIDVKKGKAQKAAEFVKSVGYLDDSHLDTLLELSINNKSKVGGIMKQLLDTDLHRGSRQSAESLWKWIGDSAERFEKIGFHDTDQIAEKVEITLGGKKIKIEKDFLIKLELHSRSLDNLKAILKTEGWQIGKEKIVYPLDAQGNDLVDRLGEIRKALEIVRNDPMLMGIADWTNELNPQRAIAINDIFRRLNGFDIARDPKYTSRPRVLPKRVEGSKETSIPPEQQGPYQPRVGGRLPMRLDRWSDDFLSSLEMDASLQMAESLRNARILVSNPKFQNAMRAAGRGQELDNMITILRRTQGVTTSRSTLEKYGGKIQRGVTTSALGFRVSTIGTQAMSYPAAFSEIDSFMRPMGPVGKVIERIEEDSALMALRWRGRRIGVEVGTSASFEAFDTMIFGHAKKLSNIALKKLITGDKFAIGNIYDKGVVPELLSVPRNGKNVEPFEWEGVTVADLPAMTDPDSRAFRYATARRLEYVVRRSQPMFDMLDRSVSLANPAMIERQLTIFRTALEAQEGIVIRATDTYAKSSKTLADKKELIKDVGSVVISAFSVAAWKKGLKWAIGTGVATVLAAFGIYKFDDRKARESLPEEIAKDTAKNMLRLTKTGKFAVRAGELIADKIAGEGYNWNRNTFDLPIIDVLESGVDAVTAVSQVLADSGLLDEFVDEVTQEDKEFNEQLVDKLYADMGRAIRSSYDFGVRIAGLPLLAPVQEFLRPALIDSKIKIIREVTFGDVESPKQFSEKVFALFEKRTELKTKSKKKRLTREEEIKLITLDRFVTQANKLAEIVKEIEDPELRKLRFSMFEITMSMAEQNVNK